MQHGGDSRLGRLLELTRALGAVEIMPGVPEQARIALLFDGLKLSAGM